MSSSVNAPLSPFNRSIAIVDLDFEPYKIVIKQSFEWDDLAKALSGYLEHVKSEVSDMSEPARNLLEELSKWLDDSESSKLDARNSLEFWVKKIDECESELPQIEIREGSF